MKTRGAFFICLLILLASADTSFSAFSKKEIKTANSAISRDSSVTHVQEAMKEFNSLSRRVKRSRFKEIKKAINEYKVQKRKQSEVNTNTLLLVIISILIPPLAVYLHEGEINTRFWISVLLTVLGLILFGSAGILFLGTLPAIAYALYVILNDL